LAKCIDRGHGAINGDLTSKTEATSTATATATVATPEVNGDAILVWKLFVSQHKSIKLQPTSLTTVYSTLA
jgi:hypothetical protein